MSTLLSPPPSAARSRPTSLALLRAAARSDGARQARFIVVGGVCALLQLLFLFVLKQAGMASLPSNIAAYLLSAEVNFYLSDAYIWHDRRGVGARGLGSRWLAFHLSIAGTFVVSQLVFLFGVAFVTYLVASALGIGVAAVLNFAIQDRLTFRTARRG
jgi:putative flippase GtrA